MLYSDSQWYRTIPEIQRRSRFLIDRVSAIVMHAKNMELELQLTNLDVVKQAFILRRQKELFLKRSSGETKPLTCEDAESIRRFLVSESEAIVDLADSIPARQSSKVQD